jgi:hypothetical protein
MKQSIALGVAGLLLPAIAVCQADSVLQADTTAVRFQRPVSRIVLETAWAAADTQQRQPAAMVLRRPAWSSQAVLYQRMIRQRPTDPPPRIAIAAHRIPRPAAPPPTPAEDSTLRRQRAADFRVRAEAVSRIEAMPVARLHPSIAANLISELDSVGAGRVAAPPASSADSPAELEEYPEYVISLARAVVRLKDPRSVRALTFGGLATSREVQRFVAAQGREGLGALDTAFAASDATAPAVVSTWGYALAETPSRLAFEDSVYVYARIVLSAQYYPVAFAYAARHANLFDLMPELDSIAARAAADSALALAAAARVASRALAPALDSVGSAIAADWLARLRLRTGVLCMDEARLGAESCRAMLDATGSAARSIGDLTQVRQAMTQYLGLLDQAVSAGRMSVEAREGLKPVINGLLRASGDTRVRAPVARPDLRRPLVR